MFPSHDRDVNMDTRVIYVNSKSRSFGDIYNATFNFPNYIFSVDEYSHIELQLQSFVCKYSFYNIDTGRNADMEVSINTGASFTAKQLPVGNYNTKELAANIQAMLRTVTADTIKIEWDKNLIYYKWFNTSTTIVILIWIPGLFM